MTKPQFFVSSGYGERFLTMLHFTQTVRIGDRVQTSGQGGWDDDLQIPESIEDEIVQAFRNVERALSLAGADWSQVVHVNSYHVGGFPPIVNETMSKCFRERMPDQPPIWTQVGIESLGLPAMRVEIRVEAFTG